jgi:hypothetical protein
VQQRQVRKWCSCGSYHWSVVKPTCPRRRHYFHLHLLQRCASIYCMYGVRAQGFPLRETGIIPNKTPKRRRLGNKIHLEPRVIKSDLQDIHRQICPGRPTIAPLPRSGSFTRPAWDRSMGRYWKIPELSRRLSLAWRQGIRVNAGTIKIGQTGGGKCGIKL